MSKNKLKSLLIESINKNSGKKSYTMDYKINSGKIFQHTDAEKVVANGKVKVIIDYPLDKTVSFTATKKEFTLNNIVDLIIKCYKNIYSNPKKYGVSSHGSSDLWLEKVTIENNTITMFVGS